MILAHCAVMSLYQLTVQCVWWAWPYDAHEPVLSAVPPVPCTAPTVTHLAASLCCPHSCYLLPVELGRCIWSENWPVLHFLWEILLLRDEGGGEQCALSNEVCRIDQTTARHCGVDHASQFNPSSTLGSWFQTETIVKCLCSCHKEFNSA